MKKTVAPGEYMVAPPALLVRPQIEPRDHWKLAMKFARMHGHRFETVFLRQEVVSLAYEEIVECAPKFDPIRGYAFSTFAMNCMYRAMCSHARREGRRQARIGQQWHDEERPLDLPDHRPTDAVERGRELDEATAMVAELLSHVPPLQQPVVIKWMDTGVIASEHRDMLRKALRTMAGERELFTDFDAEERTLPDTPERAVVQRARRVDRQLRLFVNAA
jgi:hypothetical protein